MTYKEAYALVEGTKSLGSRPGLENIRQLCAALGDPQDKVPCIHIAGTNGKGSTSAMIASVLSAAGFKTGLYVSPHLTEYRDCLFINGKMIGKRDFAKIIAVIKRKTYILAKKNIFPTEFEILTAAAFLWFEENGCDFSVIETGLGGRLDATNVIKKPLVSVITAISKDHTAILGEEIASITREKCGILKPQGIAVSYPVQQKEAMEEIKKVSSDNSNTLFVPDLSKFKSNGRGLAGSEIEYKGISIKLPLIGEHQVLNAATALEVIFALSKYHNLSIAGEHIKAGIANVKMPARMEVLKKKPLVLLDGAHNLQGVEALVNFMRSSLKGKKTAVIMGMLKDKQYEECIMQIAFLCERFIGVTPQNERALDAKKAAVVAKKYCSNTVYYDDYAKAYENAREFAEKGGAVVICGSLYLAGPMRTMILKK